MENQTETSTELIEAIKGLGQALETFKEVVRKCRSEGMTNIDIRDAIVADMSDKERAEFMQIWPFFSMMLTSL